MTWTFPVHDPYWSRTADFVERYRKSGERFVGPWEFVERIPGGVPARTRLPERVHDFQWVIVNRANLEQFDVWYLESTVRVLRAAFANEVFVVFTSREDLPALAATDVHLTAFHEQLRSLMVAEPETRSPSRSREPWLLDRLAQRRVQHQPATARYLLLQSVDLNYAAFIEAVYRWHAAYARSCEADYIVATGNYVKDFHPSWNRVPLLLMALKDGYDKIVWLDADSVVVDPSVSIFTETDSSSPLLMTRFDNVVWDGEPHENAGVMVVNRTRRTKECLEWVLRHRFDPPLPHHHEAFWEQNLLLDYVRSHRGIAHHLDHRFNFVPDLSPSDVRPVIMSFHGQRFDALSKVRNEVQQLAGAMSP